MGGNRFKASMEQSGQTAHDVVARTKSEKVVVQNQMFVKTAKIGASVTKSLVREIEKSSKSNKRDFKEEVNYLLDKVYDPSSDKFTVEFTKKEKTNVKTFTILERFKNKITEISKETGRSETEIFIKLIETALDK